MDDYSRIRGCLLGGAVGNALGAPIERESLAAIRARFGAEGLTDYAPAYGRLGAITADTQMTLFTVEGLIRAMNRGRARGICGPSGVLWHAYQRWLATQGVSPREPMWKSFGQPRPDGWLIDVEELHRRRGPGASCLKALFAGGFPNINHPVNDSKGCGAVTRVAPVGLSGTWNAFELGCEAAATTHGHPAGYQPAGFLAALVQALGEGATLEAAIDAALAPLSKAPRNEETMAAVRDARALAARGGVSPEGLETLGDGWTGDRALAIALAASLAARDFRGAVLLAVNHSGDSNAAGVLAGQIWGAMAGVEGIPATWLERLELRGLIETLAEDLYKAVNELETSEEDGTYDWDRYPGC
ncbi:MAG TPA: ADP-ribosylglycohydrolase family protein [Acidobacteriota bacterium]|mgnify:CR=1 FL=1|nr:ADP-ribosylglycohydrolase family protein [Acidobacteriota bacterium]